MGAILLDNVSKVYGGNVVACAAANATLDVIEDEALVAAATGTDGSVVPLRRKPKKKRAVRKPTR